MINNTTEQDTEPRYLYSKATADELRKKLSSQIPVKLNEIVKALGIPVKLVDLQCDGISRMDSDGTCFIMCNKNTNRTRQRFTVAHELGHIILEHISITGDSSQCSHGAQEKEANQFAGSLLVPSRDLKTFMKNADKTIEDIVQRYWISKEAAIIAIQSNKLLNKLKI